MTIQLACPGCGKSLQAPDAVAGKPLKCPNCQHVFTAPEGVVDAEVVGGEGITTAPAEPVRERAGYREIRTEREGEHGEERRPCPMCGEMIMADAAKCRFCGEIFDPELRRIEELRGRRGGTADRDADLDAIEWVIAILCSNIGCIIGIVYLIQGKPKGTKMLGVSVGVMLVWVVVGILLNLVLEAAKL